MQYKRHSQYLVLSEATHSLRVRTSSLASASILIASYKTQIVTAQQTFRICPGIYVI